MSAMERCELCGVESHEVRVELVEWTAAIQQAFGLPTWDKALRCRDHQACRARMEATGQPWPIRDDHTHPTVEPPPPAPEEVPL